MRAVFGEVGTMRFECSGDCSVARKFHPFCRVLSWPWSPQWILRWFFQIKLAVEGWWWYTGNWLQCNRFACVLRVQDSRAVAPLSLDWSWQCHDQPRVLQKGCARCNLVPPHFLQVNVWFCSGYHSHYLLNLSILQWCDQLAGLQQASALETEQVVVALLRCLEWKVLVLGDQACNGLISWNSYSEDATGRRDTI